MLLQVGRFEFEADFGFYRDAGSFTGVNWGGSLFARVPGFGELFASRDLGVTFDRWAQVMGIQAARATY